MARKFQSPRCRRADIPFVFRALAAPVVFFAPFWADFSLPAFAVFLVVAFAVIGDANYVLHWHTHRPFTTSRACNLLLDLCLGATTGVTASNWRIQHVFGHHFGADARFCDTSVSMREGYSPRRALAFCLRSFWPSIFGPFREAFEKGVLASVKSPLDYRWAFVEQCLLVALIAALLAWRPGLTLFYLLPWYACVFLVSRYVDYLNHYGCGEAGGDPLEVANNTSHAFFNFMTGNFGWHTAHHLYPRAHWTKLPAIHRRIARGVPAPCLKDFSWSILCAPQHVFLARKGRM
jgi:fatty acid desaturase